MLLLLWSGVCYCLLLSVIVSVNFPMQLYAKPCYDGYCFVPGKYNTTKIIIYRAASATKKSQSCKIVITMCSGWFALLTATSFAKQTHTLGKPSN